MDFINDITVTKQDGSQVKIEGEIPFAVLQKHRAAALKKLGENVSIDGFRKGNVPEDMLVKHVGKITILTEMAERALAATYPEIVKAHELAVIGHPEIQITKIAPDNPLGFTARVAIIPEITLPDYKAIAAKLNTEKDSAEVTEVDVEKQIEDILRQKVAYDRLQEKAAKKAEAEKQKPDVGDTTELPTPESEAAKEAESEEDFDPAKLPLPELTDDYVKTLGQPGQFETVEDFKAKIREHLAIEKEREVAAQHRAKVTDAIIDESAFELPAVLVDAEISQMLAQMNEDLARANLKFDAYLKHIKKTKEELTEEWKPAAEKRARLQLVLNEIAKVEETKPDEAQLEAQVKQLLEQYKDADENRVRVYVASVMTNEAVMQLLENQT